MNKVDLALEEARIRRNKAERIARDNKIYGALWDMKQQVEYADVMINDHSNDLNKIVLEEINQFNDEQTVNNEALFLLQQYFKTLSPESMNYIIESLSQDEIITFIKNHKLIIRELKKNGYKLTPNDVITQILVEHGKRSEGSKRFMQKQTEPARNFLSNIVQNVKSNNKKFNDNLSSIPRRIIKTN